MKSLLSILFLLICFSVFSQNPCASDEQLDLLIENNKVEPSVKSAHSASVNHWRSTNLGPHNIPSGIFSLTGGTGNGCVETNYIIPVIVHVVHHPNNNIGSNENINSSQIVNQINQLNNVFADDINSINTGIQFFLDTIYRHSSSRFYQMSLHQDSFDLIRQEYNIDESKYLNIYVINKVLSKTGGTTPVDGYSSYPFTIGSIAQGTVMEYDVFGHYNYGTPIRNGNEGDLLAHEVGHYLGLFHPWEQECSGSTYPNCKDSGDLCCDVAQSKGEITNCNPTLNSCPDSSDYDAVYNLMSYTSDACRKQFTNDQLSVMLSTLHTYRSQLADPRSVNTVDSDSCFWVARFVGSNLVCYGDDAWFEAYNLGTGVTYKWEYKKKWQTSYSSTIGSGLYQYTVANIDTGTYDIKLTISVGSSNKTYVYPYNVQVIECSPMESTKANWLFGDHAGLHFYDNKVTRSTGPRSNAPNIQSYEGSTSYSDSSGNLKAYAGGQSVSSAEVNGLDVYGHRFRAMTNSEIDGSSSSAQSMIVIPYNSDTSKLHLFTRAFVGSVGNLQSVFNRNLIDLIVYNPVRTQYGSVTLRNDTIRDTLGNLAGPSEAISAIKRCDDSTFWLLTTNPAGSGGTNYVEFYVVSDTGVRFSHRQSIYTNQNSSHTGFIKFSPDGLYVWVLNSLYEFCRADGSLTLKFNDSLQNSDRLYGVTFSPNSKLMYISGAKYKGSGSNIIDSNFYHYLYQYDLQSQDVFGSRRAVAEFEEQDIGSYFRALQVAPDGKIYVTAYNQSYVAVVNKPNERVTNTNECEFQAVGPVLNVGNDGGICKVGLPNFIDADPPLLTNEGFIVERISCFEVKFRAKTCCANSFKWFFGDGDSSELQNPSHTYADEGIYTVVLIVDGDPISQEVEIGFIGELKIYGREVLCDNSIEYEYYTDFDKNKEDSVIWIVDGGDEYYQNKKVHVFWSDTASYIKAVVTNLQSGCIDSVTKYVYWSDSIDVDFSYTAINCSDIQFETFNYCDSGHYWMFGDGTDSYRQDPFHTYASDGSYTVKLIVGKDTVTKTVTIGIGAADKVMTGVTVNCDDSTSFQYSLPYNSGFAYQWSAIGNSSLIDSVNIAYAVWSRNGQIQCIITDSVTGCVDTISLDVKKKIDSQLDFDFSVTNCTQVQFNTEEYCNLSKKWLFGDGDTSLLEDPSHSYNSQGIYTVSLIVDGDTVSKQLSLEPLPAPNILGDRQICYTNEQYTYSATPIRLGESFNWSVSNGTLVRILTDTSILTEFTTNGSIELISTSSFGCSDTSVIQVTVHTPIQNTISVDSTIFCQVDSNSVIHGSDPSGGTGNYSYQWYSSSNGTDYSIVSGATNRDFYLSPSFSTYYRRLVKSGDCESYSNSVNVARVFESNTIWTDEIEFCTGGDSIHLKGNSLYSNIGNNSLTYVWESSSDNASWSIMKTGSSGTGYTNHTFYDTILHQDTISFYRRKLDIPYFTCVTYSNVLEIKPGIYITKQPEDVLLCDPSSDQIQFDLELRNLTSTQAVIKAEFRASGDPDFTELGTVNGMTYTYTSNKSSSYNLTDTFRFKVTTSCGTVYSRKALLFTNIQGDIWIRDSWKDNGTEPNPDSSHYDIVRSPDIWNRVNSDNGLVHQQCEFKNLSPNQLGIKVRNRASVPTVRTPLYLYWTLGQINNEEWDLRWLDTIGNQFWNDPLSDSFPMGSRINSAAIMVPPIAPGDSLNIFYDWYPPNPAHYYPKDANGNKAGDFDRLSVCILARLEHCEDYPHRMSRNEAFGVHAKYNAIGNNNIATKNIWVVDSDTSNLVDNDNDGEIDYMGGSWIGFGRLSSVNGGLVSICIEDMDSNFFSNWDFAIRVEERLISPMIACLPQNSHIVHMGGDIFAFAQIGNYCINNLSLPDNDVYFFAPMFDPANGWDNIDDEYYELGIEQRDASNNVVGAGSVSIDNTNGEFDDLDEQLYTVEIQESPHLLLAPNPTQAMLSVELDEVAKGWHAGQTGTIVVANNYGVSLVTETNVAAENITHLDLSALSAGLYNVRFEIGGTVYYRYLVKVAQ